MSINTNALTPACTRKLAKYEKTIKEGIKTFYKVGDALMGIRDEKLYLNTHSTFRDYCKDKWDFSDNYARRIIDATETREAIKSVPIVTLLPATESQARPLAKLPEKERAEAWAEAVNTAKVDENGKPKVTAKHVEKVVEERMEPEEEVEEEEEIEPMKDGHGAVIPPKLEEIFTDGPPTIKELMNRVSKLNKDIKDVVEEIPGCLIIPIVATDISLKDCRTALKSAIPTWVCVCKGRGCKKCDQRGWLQKQCGVLFDEVEK